MWRRLPPAYSPLTCAAALAGWGHDDPRETVAARIAAWSGAGAIALTDSGTSALALALRASAAARGGRPCALPGYGCFDLVTAAAAAGVRAIPYDLDPTTLQPDPASLERAIAEGVSSVVIVHLYGIPVPLAPWRPRIAQAGAFLIEDAAQGAGGHAEGIALGAGGDFGVLSFGRGKGLTGGGGGALLARDPEHLAAATQHLAPAPGTGQAAYGVRVLTQWALGRPSTYAVPARLPFLRLGETVFSPPHRPTQMRPASARVLRRTLPLLPSELAIRRENATRLLALLSARGGRPVLPPPRVDSAWLRLPVIGRRSETARRRGAPLGCMPGYPTALIDLPEAQPHLAARPQTPGAAALASTLWTVPLHSRLTQRDLERIAAWVGALDG